MESEWWVIYVKEDDTYYPQAAFVDEEQARSFGKKIKSSYYTFKRAVIAYAKVKRSLLPQVLVILKEKSYKEIQANAK